MMIRRYTVKQVADTLQVSQEAIRRAIRTGQLQAEKILGGWKVPELAVEEWVRKQQERQP